MTRDELYMELEGCTGPSDAMPYIDRYVAAQLAEVEQQTEGHVQTRIAAERERLAQIAADQVRHYPEDVFPPISDLEHEPASVDRIAAHAMRHAYRRTADIIREGGEPQ